MNLFVVHRDPIRAAQMLCDRHVVKMPLETAQILCTVATLHEIPEAPYRPTHRNHPCVLWAARTAGNWRWTIDHGLALCREYEHRYGKTHKSLAVIAWCLVHPPFSPANDLEPFVQVMPEAYRGPNAVKAYRRYYLGEKSAIATWKSPARPPRWWEGLT